MPLPVTRRATCPRDDAHHETINVVITRAAAPLALAASLAACSGGTSDVGPTASPTPSPTAASVAPLTGERVEPGAELDHPALAVKVSDVPEAHPQVGVDQADIVFVEPLGTSYTRLAAVFHSDVPDVVGPVRSVRPVDGPLLGPLAPVFASSMGAGWVIEYVDDVADIDSLGTLEVTGSGAYTQDATRTAPNHVFAHPDVLLDLSKRSGPPDPYFAYAANPDGASAATAGTPATSVVVPYGPAFIVRWRYDEASGRYLREQPWGPHVTSDGTQLGADNVLVLSAASTVEKLRPGSGTAVPVPQLVDSAGDFVALSGGQAVRGVWTKGRVNEPFELRTDDGEELLLAPGTTWVELPEPTAKVVVEG